MVVADPSREEIEVLQSEMGSINERKFVLWAAGVWVALLILVSLTVQWLPLHDPTTVVGAPNQGPSLSSEFFGTDEIGRSMLARLCFGARVSLIISLLSTALAAVVGGLLGLVAAYYGRLLDTTADLVGNSVLSIPPLLLLMATILAYGHSVFVITIAIAIRFVPAFMRLTRANGLSQIGREYVVAARSLGASSFRMICRELLPNTAPALVSYAVLVLPAVMILEGALSFLGFGVNPPTPSWGSMIALGAQNLESSPWPALMPCIVLTITVFSFNTLGDHFRSGLDVREVKL